MRREKILKKTLSMYLTKNKTPGGKYEKLKKID